MTTANPKSSSSRIKSILVLSACGWMAFSLELKADYTIDANTTYDFQSSGPDLTGETLIAGAADLGTTKIKFVNVSNTSWSSTPTATPHFSSVGNQAFRGTDFSNADWSGVSFTSPNDGGAQFFIDADFTDANFSNTVFNLLSTNGRNRSFFRTDLSGTNFSDSYLDFGTNNSVFDGTIFSSTTNFSGATLLTGESPMINSNSLVGVNFSNATLRTRFTNMDLSDANFQDAIFVASDGVTGSLHNSVAEGTDFRGTDFTGIGQASYLESVSWNTIAPIYDANTVLTTQDGTFDAAAAGWTLAAIPEPNTLTLLGLGAMFLLASRYRRNRVTGC